MLFVLGFFVFHDAEIVEIFVEVVISISLLRFFRMLKIWASIEAFTVCHSLSSNPQNNKNLIETEDSLELYQEIKNTPAKDIVKEEVQTNCMTFILLQTKKIKVNKCMALCSGDREMKNKEQAVKTYRFYYKVLLLFVIVIPLCFIVITITNRRAPDRKTAIKVISAIKGATTVYCMMHLINFVHSLEHSLPELNLLTKFFAVKLILLFTIIQTIVLNNLECGNGDFSDEEMGSIINFFMLNVENCLLSFLWVYTYGYGGLGVEKLKSLLQRPSSTELIVGEGTNRLNIIDKNPIP